MNYWVNAMEKRLSEEEKFFLKSIYSPQVVTVPPCDACRNMCVTADGEIRIYGAINKTSPEDIATRVYLSSSDCGLSWKMHLMPKGAIGAAALDPESGRCISSCVNEYRPDLKAYEDGTWAMLCDEDFNSANIRYVKLSDKKVHILKPPMLLERVKRWLILGEYTPSDYSNKQVVVFYSDDNGESWKEVLIEKSAPKFIPEPPHKGTRWQQYSCEPSVAELSNGELIMIVRTSQNYHYMYRSYDNGESWNGPEPSPFHGTITMPILHKLNDGRIVFLWCNTQPMPELEFSSIFPPLGNDVRDGIWEDVFTNRDANHLAISEDDAASWKGFRELFLNTIRNNADFRSIGGNDSRDKSVHQGQMLELPYNKLLIHFGQNTSARKVVILDLDWLYESERREDFRMGLQNVSTQMYVKSNLGGFRGFSGHCAYNRTHGALLIPDPDGNFKEVLQLCYIDDERLVYKKQGVVWNFPASSKGKVSIELKVLENGVRIALCDRWYNPADDTAAAQAPLYVDITDKGDWQRVDIQYDTAEMTASVTVGGITKAYSLRQSAPNGLSYLHIQTLACSHDQQGTLIRLLEKK